jgi:hypothetical protein
MERRFFLKLLAASIAATNLYVIPNLHARTSGSYPKELTLRISLSGAGRLGFYIDYSELDDVGTHTFYVSRTHGSQGVVSVQYSTHGDNHNGANGTLTWEDQDLGIKSFTVDVSTKPLGEHRIYAKLSNGTGGAELHHGDDTVAYGVIDDDTIATSNAIFIDTAAPTNGDGSLVNPYNNWYSGRDSLSVSDRYIYIKGMMIPDGTDITAMSNTVKHLALKNTFEGRTSEEQRLIIRNWPGFTGGVDGGGQTDVAAFACDAAAGHTGSVKFITFKNLSITNLNNEDGGIVFGRAYFLRTRGLVGGESVEYVTAEHINVDGILSGANAATAVWYSEQCSNLKMWGCNITNTTYANKGVPNLHAFQTYGTQKCSIQCNTLSSTAGGIYEKEGLKNGVGVGMVVRFNFINSGQITVSTQGGSPLMDFHIFSHNVLASTNETSHSTPIDLSQSSTTFIATKTQINNNVFYDYDYSNVGEVRVKTSGYTGIIMFNNIFNEIGEALRIEKGTAVPEYIDYNAYYNQILTAQPLVAVQSNSHITLSELQSNTSFEQNASVGNPLFVDAANGNFRLENNSPAVTGGVDGTRKGVYLLGIEKIGTRDLTYIAPPARMEPPEVTIIE